MTAPDRHSRPPVRSGLMQLRMKPELRGAISKAAEKRSMTDSAWLRSAALTVLMLEGIGTVLQHEDDLTSEPA